MNTAALPKFQRENDIDVYCLELDRENPRFGLADAHSEEEALNRLVEHGNLKELWDSINSQGWIPFEPIVVIEKVDQRGRYVVIEGNRRIAAIQALLKPSIVADRLQRRVPEMRDGIASQIEKIDVVVVDSRHDADAYVGFKHVNGPASWGSLPKAKFASEMFLRQLQEGGKKEDALKAVQDAIGETSVTTLLRMLVGYKVFEQAMDLEFLPRERAHSESIDFSHLYTMMPNPATRLFIGLSEAPLRADSIVNNPVPNTHVRNLELLTGWLFGGERVEKVIKSQGRDRDLSP